MYMKYNEKAQVYRMEVWKSFMGSCGLDIYFLSHLLEVCKKTSCYIIMIFILRRLMIWFNNIFLDS